MKIEKTEIFGFKASLRAMRNPLDSWDKSDSKYTLTNYPEISNECIIKDKKNYNFECVILGDLDKNLSQKLVNAGTEHCKHLRMIQVWADLTLPRYIWCEFDTYRNLEKISCSTMHTLMKNPISSEIFENGFDYIAEDQINTIQELINDYQRYTVKEQKKRCKYAVKSILPESFLQKRTINTNYMTLLNIYQQRKNHELPQWHMICNWILNLPYFTELTGVNK